MCHRCDRTLIEYKDQMKDENAETNCLSLHSGNKTVVVFLITYKYTRPEMPVHARLGVRDALLHAHNTMS